MCPSSTGAHERPAGARGRCSLQLGPWPRARRSADGTPGHRVISPIRAAPDRLPATPPRTPNRGPGAPSGRTRTCRRRAGAVAARRELDDDRLVALHEGVDEELIRPGHEVEVLERVDVERDRDR